MLSIACLKTKVVCASPKDQCGSTVLNVSRIDPNICMPYARDLIERSNYPIKHQGIEKLPVHTTKEKKIFG